MDRKLPGIHKFVTLRLSNEILPLDNVRVGDCGGQPAGLCALDKFLESQSKAFEESNFAYACHGDHADKISDPTSAKDWDGAIHEAAAQMAWDVLDFETA